jgi:hypothetical protein
VFIDQFFDNLAYLLTSFLKIANLAYLLTWFFEEISNGGLFAFVGLLWQILECLKF